MGEARSDDDDDDPSAEIDLSLASVWSQLSNKGEVTASLIVRTVTAVEMPRTRARPTLPEVDPAQPSSSPSRPIRSRDSDSTQETPLASPTRLHVGEELARGGMAIIQHAYDRAILREVAVKRTTPTAGDEFPDAAELLIEEAQITGQLEHPNIVPIHDLSIDGGTPAFAMTLVRGHTYLRLISESSRAGHPPALLRRALEVFLKVCDAVAFAHGRGVIHRDLKPDNIMIGSHGQVYVMDWGCALLITPDAPADGTAAAPPRVTVSQPSARRSAAHVLLGTAAYMAPEQARGDIAQVGPRSDVYALGAILYQLLTRRAPHQAPTFMAAVEHAQSGVVIDPLEVAPGRPMPRGLIAIAMRALAAAPADRYRDVAALRAAVETFLVGAGAFPQRHFAAGEVIVHEGAPSETAYLIDAGVCEAARAIHGVRTVVRRMNEGDVFGETAFVTAQPRSATVTAVTDVAVTEIARATLEADLGMNAWIGAFLRTLATRFRDAERRLDDGGWIATSHFARVIEATGVHLRIAGALAPNGGRSAPWPALRDALAAALELEPALITEAVRSSTSLRLDDDETTVSGRVER